MRDNTLRSMLAAMAALIPLPDGQSLAYDRIQGDTLAKVCKHESKIQVEGLQEVKCPQTIRDNLIGEEGFVIFISDPQGKDFVVPNAPSFELTPNAEMHRYTRDRVQFCSDWRPKENNASDPLSVMHLPFHSPLYTIAQWKRKWQTKQKKKLVAIINANWFDIRAPHSLMYNYPCTNLFGLAVANGIVLSTPANVNVLEEEWPESGRRLVFGEALDALVFSAGNGQPRILQSHEIRYDHEKKSSYYSYRSSTVRIYNAVSGFIILKDRQNPISWNRESNKPDRASARTGVGLMRDGRTMIIVVIQPGRDNATSKGVTARTMSDLFKSLGANDAINLDNSGSSGLIFDYYKVQNGKREAFRWTSLRGDRYPAPNGRERHRPIPLFLGLMQKNVME